jgi:hypothetical protein
VNVWQSPKSAAGSDSDIVLRDEDEANGNVDVQLDEDLPAEAFSALEQHDRSTVALGVRIRYDRTTGEWRPVHPT